MSVSKIVAAAASSAGGAGLDVDEVFSTFLYTGNGTAGRTITNNIDISTEGGLIWTKSRSSTYNHTLGDTANGVNKYLYSNTTADIDTSSAYYSAFNTNGYVIGDAAQGFNANELNANSVDYVSWTFRKAPKFFDVLTYTGTGSAQNISHNLGSVPGMMIVKKTNASQAWTIFHRSLGATKYLLFDTSDAGTQTARWNDTEPTSTQFTVGTSGGTNDSGDTYVAYLFANNNNDGEFGPSADQDIIKCGSYTGNGSSTGPVVTLGFEPQFIMIKRTDDPENANWFAFDSLRGITTGGDDPYLYWNTTAAEVAGNALEVTSTGFQLKSTSSAFNGSSASYIYMAIRRGPLAAPESATDVFHIQSQSSGSTYSVGFPIDLVLHSKIAGSSINAIVGSRLTGNDKYLITSSTAAEGTSSGVWDFDLQNSFKQGATTAQASIGWHWKRAPSYFDVVAYTGSGGASQSIDHNLGVVPEMIWVKDRGNASNWSIYHSTLGISYVINFDTGPGGTGNQYWGTAAHTSSVFKVGSDTDTGGSSRNYIAYLFATVAGVSKVGTCSHTFGGGDTNVDCGFSNGCRFLLIKSTTHSYSWEVYDSVRGIVSGNDPYLKLNTADAEVTNNDGIDPLSSGFTLTSTGWNTGTYIFYAIA